jgi:hypothetical protein
MRRDRGPLHAIRGPLTLITVGVLFALQNFTPYSFDQTWPVLLIVFGLLTLLGRSSQPAPPAPQPPPPYNFPPPNASYRPQQPYSQSPYSQPAPPTASTEKNPGGTT